MAARRREVVVEEGLVARRELLLREPERLFRRMHDSKATWNDLDAEAVRDLLPVPCRVAEQRAGCLRSLHEQLLVVLPRVADATQQLDAVARDQPLAVTRGR